MIQTLTGGVGGLFKKNKIEVIEGEASLGGDGTVRVGGDEHKAARSSSPPARSRARSPARSSAGA